MSKNNYENIIKLVAKLDLKFENKLNELTMLLPNNLMEKIKQFDDFTINNRSFFANKETNDNAIKLYVENKNDDKIFSISVKNIDFKTFFNDKYKLILDLSNLIFSHENVAVKHSISLLNNGQQIEFIEEIDFFNKNLTEIIKEPILNRKNIPIEKFKSLIDNQILNIN